MTEKRFKEYYQADEIVSIHDTLTNESINLKQIVDLLNEQDIEIKRLKDELFEARKDYIVDTADISDKPYLDEMIEEERKEIYGDVE